MAAAVAAVVPGVLDIRRRFSFLDVRADAVSTMPWRIVAAERSGARHVFTAGDAPLSLAVAASCAVPGVFAPVVHRGRRLVDGGSHSMTNADLAAGDASELVVVIAPTCVQPAPDVAAVPAQLTLDGEVAVLIANAKRGPHDPSIGGAATADGSQPACHEALPGDHCGCVRGDSELLATY